MDRQNVGGSLSGQQDNYVGHGTEPSQNSMNLDGVAITDMAALGSSASYFDFDAFQEMQITTGGTDPSVSSPGVTLNMVTKRGTNEIHGSSRLFDTPGELEANNIPSTAKAQGLTTTNRVTHIDDYGIEAGGPIWPDKAWLWGSYSKNPIQLLAASVAGGGSPNNYTLENWAGKLNVQPIESNSFTFFYLRDEKTNIGRNSGLTRPGGSGTPWDQTGPVSIWKGEDSQVFGPNLVADVSWSYVHGGFSLLPQGGLGIDAFQDANGVWHNSYLAEIIYRPQHQVNGSASYFLNTGSIGHELKFGFQYRHIFVKTTVEWPGDHNFGIYDFDGAGDNLAILSRPGAPRSTNNYYSGYVQDSLTMQNLTINAGLRYDNQSGLNNSSTAPANPLINPGTGQTYLGALNYPGGATEVKWTNWEPRVGLTYALGADKTTLLRASYARYADQLGASTITSDNPVKSSYLYYFWNDANNNGIINNGELGAPEQPPTNYNPACPSCTSSTNQIDPNLKDTTTDEFMAGIDHQILPELVVGANYTHRQRKNFTYLPLIGITNSDFVLNSALSNQPVVNYAGQVIGNTGNVYGLNPALSYPDLTGGTLETNRPNYSTTYDGVELQLTKRLTNRWMAHGSFTWTNWKQSEGANSCQDPTVTITAAGGGGPNCGSSIYWYGSGTNSGSYPYVFINSKWNFNINALYQLPMNFTVAANLYGRQGYYQPTLVAAQARWHPRIAERSRGPEQRSAKPESLPVGSSSGEGSAALPEGGSDALHRHVQRAEQRHDSSGPGRGSSGKRSGQCHRWPDLRDPEPADSPVRSSLELLIKLG